MVLFKEPVFYQLFENHIVEALDVLESENQINEKMITQEKNQSYEVWFKILDHIETFRELNSFKEIMNWLKNNPWFENHFKYDVGYGTISYPLQLDDVLRRRVYDHILDAGLRPDKRLIQNMYSEFEEFLISKNVSYTVNISLSGFKYEGIIIIGPGLEIHGLNEKEQSPYNKKLDYHEPHVTTLIVYATKFPKMFRHNSLDSKEHYQLQSKHRNLGFELIEALRVFKTGKFGATKIFEYSPFHWVHHSEPYGFGITKERYGFKENEFTFDPKQIVEFRAFWKKYKEVKEKPTSRFVFHALSRFMDVYERRNKIDPVIDLIIAFEILFSNKQTYSEARSKKTTPSDILTKRIAQFLEPENEKEMQKIQKFMKVAYDLRNDIVHGGDKVDFYLDGKKIEFWDIEEQLEEVLRKCFRKLIDLFSEKKFTKNEIISDLDSTKTF